MQHISLFSGIGGFDLAATWAGWHNIVSCEINPFGRKILQYYWPESYHHDDIKTLTYEKITEQLGEYWRTDDIVLSGGFPCQPFSLAGKRKGTEDSRHLWPEMLRVIREIRPRYIVGENVFGLVNWDEGLVFEQVQSDLEGEGYEVQPYVLPACAVNAPHRRDRVWFVAFNTTSKRSSEVGGIFKGKNNESFGICSKNGEGFVAYSDNKGRGSGFGQIQSKDGEVPERNDNAESGNTSNRITADAQSQGFQRQDGAGMEAAIQSSECITADRDPKMLENRNRKGTAIGNAYAKKRVEPFNCAGNWQAFPTQSPVCGGDDGLPYRLDGITFPKWRNESIKAYGNAIVPQVAYQIFIAINKYENII